MTVCSICDGFGATIEFTGKEKCVACNGTGDGPSKFGPSRWVEENAALRLNNSALLDERFELMERVSGAEAALRVAAGLISTMPEHSSKHPDEVLEWLKKVAHKETVAHQIEMAAARHVLNNVVI